MRASLHILLALTLASFVAHARADAAEPLPEHPALVSGVLDNGVRYFIKPHSQPSGRVSLRLRLPVGSLNESDDEKGYAHLIEHLAFTGTENFPAGSATRHFEALGVTIGRHQNAFTSIDQTVYSLDLPGAEDSVVGDGLTFLADVLGRVEFTDNQVTQEQAVVMAELQTYLGPQQRTMDAWFQRVAQGARALDRPVIGTSDSIKAAEVTSAETFYRQWYTTHNATVVVVGDIDVARARALIETAFEDLPESPATEAAPTGTIAHDEAFAQVITDPDIAGATVALTHVGPIRPPILTVEDIRQDLVDWLAVAAMNRRIENRVTRGDGVIRGGGAWTGSFFSAGWSVGASAFGAPEEWRSLVTELGAELQAFRAGIGERELQASKAAVLSSIRYYAEIDHTLPSSEVAQQLLNAVHAGEPWMSGAQVLAVVERHIDGITVEEVSAVFREFDPSRMSVALTMAEGKGVPEESVVLETARAAFAGDAEVRDDAIGEVVLPEFVAPGGRLATGHLDETTGVYSAWLDNGVRVHHRHMDRRPGSVAVVLTLAGGIIEETVDTRSYTHAVVGTLQRLATRSLSSGELSALLYPRTLAFGTYVSSDALSIAMESSRGEFEVGLRLLHAVLTEPLLERAAFEQWRQNVVEGLQEAQRNPAAMLNRGLAEARSPADDPRWLPIDPQVIEQMERDSVQLWLDALVNRAPIEIAIIGDISRDEAIEMAARYIGALPARERISSDHFDRTFPTPEYPIETIERIPSATPQAAVLVGFAGAEPDALTDRRALQQAARVLTIRMNRRLREEEGLVYSISAEQQLSDFVGASTFIAATMVAPAEATRLAELIQQLFDEFAADGPSDEEVVVAFRQLETGYTEDMQEPFFWAGSYSRATYDPVPPTPPEQFIAAYRALSADQIREAFARYHGAGTRMVYIVLPDL